MPYTKTAVCEIVEFICKKNRIDSKKVFNQLEQSGIFKLEPLWASRQAKKYAVDNELDFSKLEHIKERRIRLDDVKIALGEDVPEKAEKKSIFPFSSNAAFEEAVKYELKETDFSDDDRTGLTRKTKEKILITIDDVRTKAGISIEGNKKSIFASKKAEDYAKEMMDKYEIDLEKIEKTGSKGKIRKSDIDNYLTSSVKVKDDKSDNDDNDNEIQQENSQVDDSDNDDEIQQENSQVDDSDNDDEIQQEDSQVDDSDNDDEIQQEDTSDEE